MGKLRIKLNANADVENGVRLVSENLGIELCEDGIIVNAVSGDGISCTVDSGVYTIEYSIMPEFFRGLAYCVDSIRRGVFVPQKERRYFETCGVMLDVSRNAVLKTDTVKDILRYMAVMGLNMLMLYMEDTYEIESCPMFGFMRGKYTVAELKELDSYALSLGIELIPCIQTLSHLESVLRWRYAEGVRDTERTMYVGKKATYDFIEEMFRSVRECFSSRRIHIGLDEAFDVGFGKRLKEKGYTPTFELMTEHVNRVCDIAEKYDLAPMMWSDMFFKAGKVGGDYDYTSSIPDDISERLSKNISLIYWDYNYEKSKVADLYFKLHREKLKRETFFAGAVWTWDRFVPNYVKTFNTANGQLMSCKENGIRTVFATVWNNTCAMFNIYSILPGLQMYAEHFYNKTVSESQLSKMFEICTGYKFSDFMIIGLDDFCDDIRNDFLDVYKDGNGFCPNSSAQIFFNDILIGLMDKTLSGFDFKRYYRKYLKKFEELGDMGKMNDLFNQTKLLTSILALKANLGPGIIKAYSDGNNNRLRKYVRELKELVGMYEEYHKMSFEIWHKVNKPFGWEGCDMYLSGVEGRIKTAIARIEGYLDGTFECIEEFETERVYYKECEKPLTETSYFKDIISVCKM